MSTVEMPSEMTTVLPTETVEVASSWETRIPDELVLSAQEGNDDALTETFVLVTPIALRTARKFANKPQDIEDVAAAGIEKIYVGGILERKYSAPGNFNAWAGKVVHYTGLDFVKHKFRREVPVFDNEDVDFWDTKAIGTMDNHFEDSSLIPSVQEILEVAGINETFLESYLLHHVEGYTYPEISEKLGISLPVTRKRIRQAHIQLKAKRPALNAAFGVGPETVRV